MLHSAPTGSMCVVQRNKVGREWSWRLVCGRFFPSYDANSVHGGVGFHQNAFAHIAQTINSKPTYGRSPLCTPTIKNKAINPAEERPKDRSFYPLCRKRYHKIVIMCGGIKENAAQKGRGNTVELSFSGFGDVVAFFSF